MPRRSLRCVVEIDTHTVTCPGVYLARRDDIYLSICLFGQIRRTQLTSPIFPLVLHEKFRFDKVFYTAYQPSQVATLLEDEPLIIELVQLSDIYEGGKLLAYYECNARDFLYPFPTYSPTYGTQDRDVLLERSLDFPGISPRLEFSTKTVISEASTPLVSDLDEDFIYVPRTTSRQSRTRTRSPRRNKNLSYGRPTVSSISRTRSMSPSIRRHFEALNLDDTYDEEKPPFVVRKVNSRKLTGRDPGTPSPKQKIRCMHGTYSDNNKKRRSKTPRNRTNTDYLDLYTDNLAPYYRSKAVSSFSDDASYISDTAGSDVLDLTTYRSRYRSPSPVYRATSPLYTSSLSDRYLGRTSLSPTRSDIIQARVDRAIERNRATQARLERLDKLYPYSSYRYRLDIDALDELELDLELARRRRSPYVYY